VLQVKTMSSHQRAAGTLKWTTASASRGAPRTTSISIGAAQSGHELETWPSSPRAARIPNASQAQVREPPQASGLYAVRRRHGRERVGHADARAVSLEHERVGVVQAPHRGLDLVRPAELVEARRTAQLDEAPVDLVAQAKVAVVH
jgi:hypothetical protein